MIFTFIQSAAAAGYGTRAQAFFDQIENVEMISLSTTIKNAVNQLFIDLDSLGLIDLTDDTGASDRMLAAYPMVGGAAGSHKYNMLRPSDTDAAFRIGFSGGWTHASTGALGNGTNAYGNTFLVPNTSLSQDNTSIGYYSRTDNAGSNYVEMGCQPSGPPGIFIAPKYNGATSAYRCVNSGQVGPGASPTSTKLFIASRVASGTMKLYRDGTAIFTDSTTSTGLATYTILLNAYNAGAPSPVFYSARECAFAFIGDGMTDDTEAANLTTAINTFQTALSRNV